MAEKVRGQGDQGITFGPKKFGMTLTYISRKAKEGVYIET